MPNKARWDHSGAWFIRVWIVLLVLRSSVLLIGVDRLPLVPAVGDEVIINDPAVALSRGYGRVAFSFEHSSSGINRLYRHFPPVFIWLQSLMFRVFGFSVWSLRATSMFCDIAACVAFLAILLELRQRRFAEDWIVALTGIVILLEPSTLTHARQGRMEPLGMLLGALAFFLALRAERSARHEKLLWFCSAMLVGLALGTHLANLIMWAALAVWSLRWFRRSTATPPA